MEDVFVEASPKNLMKNEGWYIEALEFATEAHGDQKRKYTDEPYIKHPIEVVNILMDEGGILDKNTIIAALLHDVVEDTSVDSHTIELMFGQEVSRLVDGMTDSYADHSHGNRAERKRLERERLAKEPAGVHSIKLADLISNAESIVRYDPSFAKVYMAEMKELLSCLTKGNVKLMSNAVSIVHRYYLKLEVDDVFKMFLV